MFEYGRLSISRKEVKNCSVADYSEINEQFYILIYKLKNDAVKQNELFEKSQKKRYALRIYKFKVSLIICIASALESTFSFE